MVGSPTSWLLIVAAVFAGAFVAAQGPIFARMAIHAGGPLQAALIAFGLGFLFILFLIVLVGAAVPKLDDLRGAPNWIWAGGVIGAAMVLLSIFAIPRIGVGSFMAAVICGQLIAAVIFDHAGAFGLHPVGLDIVKSLGVMMMLAGGYLIILK